MNKLTAVLLASAVAGASVGRAAEDYTVTLDTTFVTQYMFRGLKLSGPSIQPSVELASGSAKLGVWASDSLSNFAPSYSEVDFYAGYSFAIDDTFTVPVGATIYWYPESDRPAHEATYEVYVGVDFSFEGFTFAPRAYYDFKLEGFTFEFSAGYKLPLEALGTSLDFSAFIGTWSFDSLDKNDVEGKSSYYGFGVEVPYALAENATLTFGAGYHDGFSAKIAGIKAEPDTGGKVVFTVGLSVGF